MAGKTDFDYHRSTLNPLIDYGRRHHGHQFQQKHHNAGNLPFEGKLIKLRYVKSKNFLKWSFQLKIFTGLFLIVNIEMLFNSSCCPGA